MKRYIISSELHELCCIKAENVKCAVIEFIIWHSNKISDVVKKSIICMETQEEVIELYNEIFFSDKILFLDEISACAYIDNDAINFNYSR